MALQDKLDKIPPGQRRKFIQDRIDKVTSAEDDIANRQSLLANYKAKMIIERNKQP